MVRNCRKRQGSGLYDPGRSNTAEATGRNFRIVYGTGDSSGPYYRDVFAVILNRFLVPKCLFSSVVLAENK
jgi:hypothetical protein